MSALPIQLRAAAAAALGATADAVKTVSLGKTIDDRPILTGIDLRIAPGEFVSLLGANGAGKSTLLKVLATLTPPTEGSLLLFGASPAADAGAVRAKIGLISHQSLLYRDLSARENLEFYAKLYRVPDHRARVNLLLDRIALSARADDPVKSYSRGMTQRVAIARALVHDPELLLADEPFDGLDAPSIASLERFLTELHQAGKTIILANHNIDQSLRLTRRAVVLRTGQVVIDQPSSQITSQAVLAELEQP